jgi:hypothetical protein
MKPPVTFSRSFNESLRPRVVCLVFEAFFVFFTLDILEILLRIVIPFVRGVVYILVAKSLTSIWSVVTSRLPILST